MEEVTRRGVPTGKMRLGSFNQHVEANAEWPSEKRSHKEDATQSVKSRKSKHFTMTWTYWRCNEVAGEPAQLIPFFSTPAPQGG